MDQNEKLVSWRIYGLAVIDAFSRAAVAGRITTALTGREHSILFAQAVELSGQFPAHTCVDKAKAWSGVAAVIKSLFGSSGDEPDWVWINGERIPVKPFQQVRSVKNTPVERQWVEFNDFVLQWAAIFEALENERLLIAGNHPDLVDLWCLHRVFLRHIRATAREHWRMMNVRRKYKRTHNPNFPSGMNRPIELIRLPGFGHAVTNEEVSLLVDYLSEYHAPRDDPAASPWREDPLQTADARAHRAALMRGDGYGEVLDEEDDETDSYLLAFDPSDMSRGAVSEDPPDYALLIDQYIALRSYTRELLT
jgi:hypothetical protein